VKRRLLAATSLSFLLATLLFSGALIVTTSGIVDEAGNVLKSVSALDVLFDGTQYYYVATDGIYSLDGTTKIDIRNSQRVGINYVLSNSKCTR